MSAVLRKEGADAQPPCASSLGGHAQLLDRIYGLQRHYYDLTRKYYLIGRDTLLDRLAESRPHVVLEVGCGTGRNLLRLARRSDIRMLLGIDASAEMLKTASGQVSRAGQEGRVKLHHGFAENLSLDIFPDIPQPDAIFFSYSLSMIPHWQDAIDRAFDLLPEEGSLWVVDFWDQHTLPRWCQALFRGWLSLFSVRHLPEHISYLRALARNTNAQFELHGLGGSYAYFCRIQKSRHGGGEN